jgi:hypothetical protein
VQPYRSSFGPVPERGIELHLETASGEAVEQRPGGHGHLKHLLQAQGLSAQLHPVLQPPLGLSPLVLDWIDPAIGRVPRFQFDHIRLPDQAEPKRPERESTGDARVSLPFPGLFMGPAVKVATFHGQPVLGPEPLEVDKGALSLAE